jgi:hypothetical protein
MKLLNNCGRIIALAALLYVVNCIDFIKPFDLYHVKFKATVILGPVLAGFLSGFSAFALFLVFSLFKVLGSFFIPASLFVSLGLPLLAGSFAWRSFLGDNGRLGFFINCALPLALMVLFVTHPSSSPVYMYSFYWFIPGALYVLNTLGLLHRVAEPLRLFLAALASTFVSHAVGSVMYLFTVPSAPELWSSLLLVVALERFLFALGISATYMAALYVKYSYKRYANH